MANTLSNSSEDQLPQAGDRHESALGVLGAIAIALSALLGLNLRKFKVTK
jgi:LPXTG-motif cell wall-anchored protein